MKTLVIEWQRLLDEQKETCPRCGSTEQEVEKAVEELNQTLAPSDIAVNLVKKTIDPETFKKDPLQSNKILIAGKTLEEWLGATRGQSKCCETCGDADCRTLEYDGDIHETIPAELIVRAGITAAAYLFKIQPPQIRERIPVLKLKFKKA
jgi:hypothetical protein